MNFILFILIVLVVSIVAVVVGRRIRALQAGEPSTTVETTTEPSAAAKSQPLLAQQFRSWSERAFADNPTLVLWLNSLNATALEAFTNEIAAFTQEARIDLHWLLTQDLSHHATTRSQLNAMLSHYCQAWYYAVQTQEEVQHLQTWDQFNNNPNAPAHQPLLQALWGQLVAHQLTPPGSADMLAVPTNEQHAYMLQSIRNIAQNEPKRFYTLLPEAVAASKLAPPPTFVDRAEEFIQRVASLRTTAKAKPIQTPELRPQETAATAKA